MKDLHPWFDKAISIDILYFFININIFLYILLYIGNAGAEFYDGNPTGSFGMGG